MEQRMKTKKLTKNQLDIMKVLWKSEKALSASDIAKNNPSLNLNTIRSCLQTMLKNGVIVVDDVVYSGTVLSRSYKPVLTAEKYIADNFSGVTKTFSALAIIANLIEEEDNLEIIDEIETLLQKRKREIREGN